MKTKTFKSLFDLSGRVAVITGGAGLLGRKHAEAITECDGIAVLLDTNSKELAAAKESIGKKTLALTVDITDKTALLAALSEINKRLGKVDILINNAANNPRMSEQALEEKPLSHLENFPVDLWMRDLNVGLTGAFLCAQVFGTQMAKNGRGVILNIASDLGLIAPDQRIYRQPGKSKLEQPVKPISYSVVKSGLIGLTKYLSTYWVEEGVRSNALIPGGVYNHQNGDFVKRLNNLIPMGRMAHKDEYKAAVAFLVSDASSYMTGASMVLDGGRTAW